MRILAILFFLFPGLALGQAVRYRVEVTAPAEIAAPLREGLSLVRWQQDPQMNAELLRRLSDQAVAEARETAATEGYFSARVSVSVDESVEPRVVHVVVEAGERTRVDDIDIRITGPAAEDPEARRLIRRTRDAWNLRRGEPFRQAEWDAAKRALVRELSRWRYAAARVADSEARIDPVERLARLRVEVASGPPFRFGEVRPSGTRRFDERLVTNLAPFRAGQVYDRDQLLLYQRLLLESGYFVSAQTEADPDPAAADRMPVRVAVIEGSTQHIEAGIGYSTDAGARAELRYSDHDVLDSAWRFHSGLRLDEKIQTLDLRFDSPPRPRGRWTSFFTRARQADIQNEATRELALGTSYNWGAERTPSAFIASAHLEEQRVVGQPTDNRHAVYFGHRSTFRRTDDLISPRQGFLGMVEVGGSPKGLASRQFLRGVASASLFIPIGRSGDLLLRGQAGRVVADAREGIPSSFLFRTGGDQTVRGYAFESLGVRQGEAIVGGRYMAVVSAEYTHWIGDGWGVAAFVDAGNAWDDSRLVRLAKGIGVGPRVRTPIGPIRADIAYGQQDRSLRLHFSVGYTF
ncbi:MAG TPA: autotransporter assembly complex family protein [Burkholderiales bacterium]|nr:autotransporter assembly complex family protein [Burkholderiales bacterium]